jgi:hypothetical protein
MKEWLLYSLLLSLIYAVAVHAGAPEMTARLLRQDGKAIPVLDCALFMPNLGVETTEVVSNLKKLGFSPQVIPQIMIKRTDYADSNGHFVKEYSTEFQKGLGYYGKGTLLMSVSGYELGRSKKRLFILKLQRLGMGEAEVASSHFVGIASERMFSVRSLPRCQPAQRR